MALKAGTRWRGREKERERVTVNCISSFAFDICSYQKTKWIKWKGNVWLKCRCVCVWCMDARFTQNNAINMYMDVVRQWHTARANIKPVIREVFSVTNGKNTRRLNMHIWTYQFSFLFFGCKHGKSLWKTVIFSLRLDLDWPNKVPAESVRNFLQRHQAINWINTSSSRHIHTCIRCYSTTSFKSTYQWTRLIGRTYWMSFDQTDRLIADRPNYRVWTVHAQFHFIR